MLTSSSASAISSSEVSKGTPAWGLRMSRTFRGVVRDRGDGDGRPHPGSVCHSTQRPDPVTRVRRRTDRGEPCVT